MRYEKVNGMTSTPEENRPDPAPADWTTQNLGSTETSGNAQPQRGDAGPRRQENPGPAPQETSSEAADSAPSSDRYGRNESARNPNLDPDPQQSSDPDAGSQSPGPPSSGDLDPGETPPESNSATATPPAPAPTKPPKSNVIITVAVIVVVLLVGLIFLGYMAGIIG